MDTVFNTTTPIKTCRTCLIEIPDPSTAYNLYKDPASNTRYKLEQLIPTINLYLTPSPVICSACYNAIEIGYKFKTKCMEIERCIHLFIKKHSGAVVDLTEVNRFNLNHTDENEIDVSYVQIVDDTEILECDGTSVQYTELQNMTYDGGDAEFVDINHLIGSEYSGVTCIEPEATNVIVHSNGKKSDDTISDFYKKTPFSCQKCSYRTAYKYNLVTHLKIHMQEESLQKNIENEYRYVFNTDLK